MTQQASLVRITATRAPPPRPPHLSTFHYLSRTEPAPPVIVSRYRCRTVWHEIVTAINANFPIIVLYPAGGIIGMEQLLSLVSPSRCVARTYGGRTCNAPAMANGSCPRHGGKGAGATAADDGEKLRLLRTIHGFYGADGCALRDAVGAMRTQPRLLRLVEALCAPAPVDPDDRET